MIDYLDDAHLYPPPGAVREEDIARAGAAAPGEEADRIPARDVRDAALCLMLNKNAYWARMVLVYYGLPKACQSRNPVVLAATSVTATRIARGMHTYDRNRGSLKGYIYLCYQRAMRDVTRIAAASPEDAPAMLRRALDGAYVDGDELASRIETREMLHWTADLMAKIEQPAGRPVDAVRARDRDGHTRPLAHFLLHMSREEMRRALALLEQRGTAFAPDWNPLRDDTEEG